MREFDSAIATMSPVGSEHDLGAKCSDALREQFYFSISIASKVIDRNDGANAVNVAHITDMTLEIYQTGFESREVLLSEFIFCSTTVKLKCADGGHNDGS